MLKRGCFSAQTQVQTGNGNTGATTNVKGSPIISPETGRIVIQESEWQGYRRVIRKLGRGTGEGQTLRDRGTGKQTKKTII